MIGIIWIIIFVVGVNCLAELLVQHDANIWGHLIVDYFTDCRLLYI